MTEDEMLTDEAFLMRVLARARMRAEIERFRKWGTSKEALIEEIAFQRGKPFADADLLRQAETELQVAELRAARRVQ